VKIAVAMEGVMTIAIEARGWCLAKGGAGITKYLRVQIII